LFSIIEGLFLTSYSLFDEGEVHDAWNVFEDEEEAGEEEERVEEPSLDGLETLVAHAIRTQQDEEFETAEMLASLSVSTSTPNITSQASKRVALIPLTRHSKRRRDQDCSSQFTK
jgi:hypothetical protein